MRGNKLTNRLVGRAVRAAEVRMGDELISSLDGKRRVVIQVKFSQYGERVAIHHGNDGCTLAPAGALVRIVRRSRVEDHDIARTVYTTATAAKGA